MEINELKPSVIKQLVQKRSVDSFLKNQIKYLNKSSIDYELRFKNFGEFYIKAIKLLSKL